MAMTERTNGSILISDRFEFSAAHRLHCPGQSDEWNRERFGKCNNPRGHGHNYEIKVSVESGLYEDGTSQLSIDRLESIVDELVISRFDHKYLNEDCSEFSDRNPSVENITITCHGLLKEPIAEAGGRLTSITVWETGKTSCTYPIG